MKCPTRIIASLLSVLLVFSFVPSAWALETAPQATEAQTSEATSITDDAVSTDDGEAVVDSAVVDADETSAEGGQAQAVETQSDDDAASSDPASLVENPTYENAQNEVVLTDPQTGESYLAGQVVVVKNDAATPTESLDTMSLLSAEPDAVAESNGNDNVTLVNIPDQVDIDTAISTLESDPSVAYADKNYVMELDDLEDVTMETQSVVGNAHQNQYYLNTAGVKSAWSIMPSSTQTVYVGVIDTGCQYWHPDLAGIVDTTYMRDFYNTGTAGRTLTGDYDTRTNGGHGTHVCGIIGANMKNSFGVAGVADNVKIVPINASFMSNGQVLVSSLSVYYGYQYLLNTVPNLKVVNMSLGGMSSTSYLEDIINEAEAQGVTTVCAAGNSASTVSSYPSDYEACISVASCDNNKTASAFSDHNAYKDIAAPGESDYSTIPGSSYGWKSGTSMASPVVAGTAALLYEINPNLSVDDVKNILYSTATRWGYSGSGYGCGVVNAYAAVQKCLNDYSYGVDISVSNGTVGAAQSVSCNDLGVAGATYKFVYSNADWSDWGVIQQPSSSTSTTWTPMHSGSYTLTVNSIVNGAVYTSTKTVSISDGFTIGKTTVSGDLRAGSSLTLSNASTSKSSGCKNLKYKYVWETNGWASWGVAKDLSTGSTGTWTPTTPGTYNIYTNVVDPYGNTQTTTTTVTIGSSLAVADINIPTTSVAGDSIDVSLDTNGNTSGAKYKFVYANGDWSDWGVLQQPSYSTECVWDTNISQSGDYNIFINIIDAYGNVITTSKGISISPINAGGTYTIDAAQAGQRQYKFVYANSDWSDWGVIQNMSTVSTCKWTPRHAGAYTIYINMLDSRGNLTTKTMGVKIDPPFSANSIGISGTRIAGLGTTLTANMTGNTEGLTYKFVYEKDGWSTWGVAMSPSSSNQCTWTPPSAGTYNIYLNVIDSAGNVVTKTQSVTISYQNFSIRSFSAQPSSISLGKSVTLNTTINGSGSNVTGLKVKYVWQMNGWAQWGVIQNPKVGGGVCVWTPSKRGTYTLITNVIDASDNIVKSDEATVRVI